MALECSVERESTNKNILGPGHDKRVVNWESIRKSNLERRAQKKRKLRARKNRKAYRDFIENAFHGKNPVNP